MQPAIPEPPEDRMLTPREVAHIFGVRSITIARWAREGKLAHEVTPGGHRRYRWKAVRALLEAQGLGLVSGEPQQWELDATRLYEQGWSIRQVAERFEWSRPAEWCKTASA